MDSTIYSNRISLFKNLEGKSSESNGFTLDEDDNELTLEGNQRREHIALMDIIYVASGLDILVLNQTTIVCAKIFLLFINFL